MPAGCSRRSASAAISTTSTTSTPASYRPKPDPHGYALAVRAVRDRSRRTRCSPTTWSQNLAPAKALGMTTVWVDNGSERGNHGFAEAVVDYPGRATSATGSNRSLGDEAMSDKLQAVIERAWEERDSIGPDTKGEVRQAVDAAIAALDSGEARIAEKQGDAMGRPPMAQEGRAAVVPAEPDGGDRRRARRRALVGQGAVEIRRLGREGIRRRRLPRGARSDRPPRRLSSRPARC